MTLKQSTKDDINILLNWFNSIDDVRLWGGPNIRFPLVFDQLLTDLNAVPSISFSLYDFEDFVGFAQILDKHNYNHIGRVIIRPDKRGLKLGEKLMSLMLLEYIDKSKDHSLFVNSTNQRAINLYQKLGFVEINDAQSPKMPGSYFMVRKRQ